jgi:hypothetical protein
VDKNLRRISPAPQERFSQVPNQVIYQIPVYSNNDYQIASRLPDLYSAKDNSKVKGERVTLIKAQVAADPKIMDLENQLTHAYAYRKMVEVVANNFERDVALVSREITRRTNDFRATRKDKLST